MKYSTMFLSIIAFVAAGTVYAQNGGMEGPPDVAKIIKPATSVPHTPPKLTEHPKDVQPRH
jgi:hypothetical protein